MAMLCCGRDVFLQPDLEQQHRLQALEAAVEVAVAHGLSADSSRFLDSHSGAFLSRRPTPSPSASGGRKSSIRAWAQPRAMSPEKGPQLAEHIEQLEDAGMVRRNPQAVCAGVDMAVLKKQSYQVVVYFRAVKSMIEPVATPLPNVEKMGRILAGAYALCTLDILRGCWQCPLDEDAQEFFTMATAEDLFTPTRVSQGVLNATKYFQR